MRRTRVNTPRPSILQASPRVIARRACAEAIQAFSVVRFLDCFASLAMTRFTSLGSLRLFFTSLAIALTTAALPANADEPISLLDMCSFHVGGRLVEISGKPVKEVTFTPGGVPAKVDPNGTYQVEQMYVQYFLPANERGAYPLLLWHCGGLTGVTYETTPDGREGWLTYFLRKGYAVYVVDQVPNGTPLSLTFLLAGAIGTAARARIRRSPRSKVREQRPVDSIPAPQLLSELR